jgi:DNA-binding CsgD family transcriptional regulator
MYDVAERLVSAASVRAIGEEVADACAATIPFAVYGFVIFEPQITEAPTAVLRSTAYPVDWFAQRFPPLLHALVRELPGGIAAALEVRGAFLLYERYPIRTLDRTALWADHFRPLGAGQQLSAPLWRGGGPVGYVNITRGFNEPAFSTADVRTFDALRALSERALHGVAALGRGGLAQTLDALAKTYPYPAFLFDAEGRLRWMSEEGIVRLGIDATRLCGGCLVRGNPSLDAFRRCAALLSSDPTFDAERTLRRLGSLRRGERLAVRRFDDGGRPHLLLAVTPALAPLPGQAAAEGAVPREAPVPGLGTVESRIASLAVEGYTVLNIATRLGITEATVRTHLRRVYVKLGVHGRAELATVMYRGSAGER